MSWVSLKKKTVSVKLLIIIGILSVVLIGVVSYLSIKVSSNIRDNLVDNVSAEVMPLIIETDKSNDVNDTLLKTTRDWNEDNEGSNITVSAEKINSCLIVISEHEKGNKALKHSGDCSDLRKNKGVNTSDKAVSILKNKDIKLGDTVKISSDAPNPLMKYSITLTAPNGKNMVSDVISESNGKVESDFLIPLTSDYVGVWSYTIKSSDDPNANVSNSIIVNNGK